MAIIEPQVGTKEITSYLESCGWEVAMSGPLAQIWRTSRTEERDILVPLVESAPDYHKRVRILLNDLAQVESRTEGDVENDIAYVFFDVTNLEAEHPQYIDDSIPLQGGYQLFQSARKMIIAAAGATIRRQGHFGRSIPLKAREHARNVRLGQTKRGSYILPVISRAQPAPDVPEQEGEPHLDLDAENLLFDRRVTSTLAESLNAIESMTVRSDRTPSRTEVFDSVSVGVSHELCAALSAVVANDAVADLDIQFNWARAARQPRGAIDEATFPKESASVIEYIAKALRQSSREREHVLYGVITDLHREAEGEPRGAEVGIETIVERRRKTVWFALGEDDVEEAVRCWHARRRVVVRGVLHTPQGQRARIDASFFSADPALIDFQ